MLFYEGFIGAAAVLGRSGRGEVPFYVGGSADEGDIVKIDYLWPLLTSDFGRYEGNLTLRMSSNFG